jgi:hypothetical protein
LNSSEVLHKGCPFVCFQATTLENMSEVVGNNPANLLLGVRRYWQPLGKFVEVRQRVFSTL